MGGIYTFIPGYLPKLIKKHVKRRVLKEEPVPVAQLVEHWTPCGESTRPGYESPLIQAWALDIYEPPDGYGCGWWQAAARRSRLGTGRARLCAYVKHSTLNSAIDQELRDWRVEGRANATSSA